MLTPEQRMNGITTRRGDVPARSIYPNGSLRGAERPLVMQFPELAVLRFGFRSIPLAAPSIAAGASAWYGIKSWRIPDDIGQQMFLNGVRIELGACNPTPAADADYTTVGNVAAWGTINGTGAAIVVGINTGASEGTWTSGPSNIPFVETTANGLSGGPDGMMVFHFPPGKQEDSPQPAVFRTNTTTPLAIPLGQGMRLDVALVLRRAYVNGVTKSDGIIGRCFGELYLAKTLGQATIVE